MFLPVSLNFLSISIYINLYMNLIYTFSHIDNMFVPFELNNGKPAKHFHVWLINYVGELIRGVFFFFAKIIHLLNNGNSCW